MRSSPGWPLHPRGFPGDNNLPSMGIKTWFHGQLCTEAACVPLHRLLAGDSAGSSCCTPAATNDHWGNGVSNWPRQCGSRGAAPAQSAGLVEMSGGNKA